MKPTNKKEYNRSILGFFAMWAITTALIVFAFFQLFRTPKMNNAHLERQVASLEADSTQQYLLYSSIKGINSAMTSLNEKYNADTLAKLESYPSSKLDNTDMKRELEALRNRIVEIYEDGNNNEDGIKKQLEDCQRTLQATEERLTVRDERLRLCEDRLNNLGVNNNFSGGN